MKKNLYLLIAVIVALTGCGSATGGSTLEDSGDGVLTVWGFYEGAPKVAVDYYEKETGNIVDYQTISSEDYQTKLNTVLGTDDAPDIIMLEREYVGSYISSDNLISLDDFLSGDEQFQAYKDTTSIATSGPGIYDDITKAIGWENTSSAFFYRSDLASECLNINSVKEMEEATSSYDDYVELYNQLQESSNATCNQLSLFGYPDFGEAFLTKADAYNLQEDGTYLITNEFGEALDFMKEAVSSGIVYSPDRDKTQIVSGVSKGEVFGSILPAWGTQAITEYEQPGQWAIAGTPLNFTKGGTFLAVTNNADSDLVKEFFDMTFLNEQWLLDNMDTFGMVGNEKVMDKYLESNDGANEYFGGQDTVAKFAEINSDNDDYQPVSKYDSGITSSVEEVYLAYAVDGSIKTIDDAKEQLKAKINGLYPELEVVIE